MERLISADALKETLKNPPVYCSLSGITIDDVLTIIDEQPTAYDVEKVVEELDELFAFDPVYYGTAASWVVNKVKEIVKKGDV